MTLEELPIAQLAPYPRNARLHTESQVERVAASIKEFGWANPVLVDEHDMIVAGHCRVRAATKLGFERVPRIRLSQLTPAQIRAYVIADNQLALDAGWDEGLLAAELKSIEADGLLAVVGFSDTELEQLFKEVSAPDDFREVDGNMTTEHVCPKCGYQWKGAK